MRLWPKSLLGQVLLTVALALLLAQTVSAVLLFQAGENRREQAVLNSAAFRLIAPEGPRAFREMRRGARRAGVPREVSRRLPRPLPLETATTAELLTGETRDANLESELKKILAREGIAAEEIVIVKRDAAADPFVQSNPRLQRRLARRGDDETRLLVAALRQPGAAEWQLARIPIPNGPRAAVTTIVLQTLVLYVILIGLLFLLLRRITRPLGELTKRTEEFGQNAISTAPLQQNGPEDIRRLIAAHNVMETRIAGLLSEKDVMLGAIGHDLKTPLAALRVRIESVTDEHERSKMAASIEDITQTLDDILTLARVGKAHEAPERAELSALLGSVVEEFEDRGRPVTVAETTRVVYPIYITWLRRGIRNLISNAIRYGNAAEVSLITTPEAVTIRVDDSGPGIESDRIEEMLQPFTRGETSRNRETGGAGLGLTITRAIAQQHGGELTLSNKPEGGLRAEIQLPLIWSPAVR
ncbi:two-component sensor histidine kinase [Altererythrobacter sp. RZ02]|uniref:histidine kinase n=1 Tax=Pontixanthobacter rizhaonensis TaxID=2730337 RepID=A0A848QPA0_9SPHN|nr:ATP-binding protein [Pontixanthobacter rizhaonensis]NMW32437.1 two-component sensor histidine kinase [Pontixanthobacter rizhaonensis]